jgi:tripartite ATP-independent transporter DctM subunit
MSPELIGGAGLVIFLLLAFWGLQVAFAFMLVGFVGIILLRDLQPALSILGSGPLAWSASYTLLCFPLFVLMGMLAGEAGISNDLYEFAYKWVGHLPGGLASATIVACTGFAACSGSSMANAGTMTSVAIPQMKRSNYDSGLSSGCVAAGGTLGILIPPSTTFVLYGVLTQTSVGELFLAGIFPGLLLSLLFIMTITLMCLRNPKLGPPGQFSSWKDRFISTKKTLGAMLLFALVVGGLYLGLFTPSEAGGVGSFGAFILFIAKLRIGKGARQNLWKALKDSLKT